ncbi:MAG: serine/threonine protein kinase [Clostridia bacterium]|nr:serine/threonine protein kinase [Clostridia bacterium]
MNIPLINSDDIEAMFGNCKVLNAPLKGGQKLVFPCEINGKKCALKFILLGDSSGDIDPNREAIIDAIQARAIREVNIMDNIDSPFIVKLGDIKIQSIRYNNQEMLVYSEDWIEGESVQSIISREKLSVKECINLCRDIAKAISELWSHSIVHRDIKPLNIIRKKNDGTYVLLDMGLALDLEDKSLTRYGDVPGTKIFLSPEQLDYQHKRDIDFRSDLFALGIVMYQASTTKHPFYEIGMTNDELFTNIIRNPIVPPINLNEDMPIGLNNIICRLLSKQPNCRYRKIDILLDELNNLETNLGE